MHTASTLLAVPFETTYGRHTTYDTDFYIDITDEHQRLLCGSGPSRAAQCTAGWCVAQRGLEAACYGIGTKGGTPTSPTGQSDRIGKSARALHRAAAPHDARSTHAHGTVVVCERDAETAAREGSPPMCRRVTTPYTGGCCVPKRPGARGQTVEEG